MIDYYLKKHCPLGRDKKNPRCKACVWVDRNIFKCIFSLDYPLVVTLQQFKERIEMVDKKQQLRITNQKQRFVTDDQADKDAKYWFRYAPHELRKRDSRTTTE